jgi:hypothetical protein
MTPNTIEFQTTNNTLTDTWVMRITADRRIEVNEGVDVTVAAKQVLDAMQLMLDRQKRTWVGLTEDEAIELLPAGDWEIESTLEFAKAVESKLKENNFD